MSTMDLFVRKWGMAKLAFDELSRIFEKDPGEIRQIDIAAAIGASTTLTHRAGEALAVRMTADAEAARAHPSRQADDETLPRPRLVENGR